MLVSEGLMNTFGLHVIVSNIATRSLYNFDKSNTKVEPASKKSLRLFHINLLLSLIFLSVLVTQALAHVKIMSSPVLGQCLHLTLSLYGHWFFAWANYKNRFIVSQLINMMLKFEQNRNGKIKKVKSLH